MAKIFIAHASENKDVAQDIYYALTKKGMDVYLDEKSLKTGGEFHSTLRDLILDSDYFIFLISQYSISENSYCLTELKYAEEKWAKNGRGFLPVMIESVDEHLLPAFLRQSNYMRPKGNVTAEVSSEILSLEKGTSGDNKVKKFDSSLWEKFKDIPPFVSSVLAILAVFTGVASWVVGYFATKSELNKVECMRVLNDKLLDHQGQQITLYALYSENKYRKAQLDSLPEMTPEQQAAYYEITKNMDSAWTTKKKEGEKSQRILSILKSGDLFDQDGECRGNSDEI